MGFTLYLSFYMLPRTVFIDGTSRDRDLHKQGSTQAVVFIINDLGRLPRLGNERIGTHRHADA